MGGKSYGVCEDCRTGTATIKYSDEPVFALTHDTGVTYICRLCFIKRIKQAILDLQKNLKIQETLAGVN